jgi:hypothetical protein
MTYILDNFTWPTVTADELSYLQKLINYFCFLIENGFNKEYTFQIPLFRSPTSALCERRRPTARVSKTERHVATGDNSTVYSEGSRFESSVGNRLSCGFSSFQLLLWVNNGPLPSNRSRKLPPTPLLTHQLAIITLPFPIRILARRFSRLKFNVKLQLSDESRVEYLVLTNVSASIAVAIFKVGIVFVLSHWQKKLRIMTSRYHTMTQPSYRHFNAHVMLFIKKRSLYIFFAQNPTQKFILHMNQCLWTDVTLRLGLLFEMHAVRNKMCLVTQLSMKSSIIPSG